MANSSDVTEKPARICAHSKCNSEESSSPVSFYPCTSCRTAYYCSTRHRTEAAALHDCPKTISDKASFSRNCFLLVSQQTVTLDSYSSVSVLEDAKRQKLLEHSHARILAAKEKTRAIHTQIAAWNPDIARQFEEKAAPFSDTPLRVLRSRWDLVEKEGVVDYQSFVALSYCWRSPEWDAVAESYHAPGADVGVPISRCLWDFLLGLLDSHEEAIWIDQICIDQMNDSEKRSAVASMDALYSVARLVFVAIEDVVLTAAEVQVLSEAFRQVAEDQDWTLSSAKAHQVFAVVQKIFSARWFHRSWCFHEYHLSSERVLAIPCENTSTPGILSAIGIFNLGEFVFRLAYFQNAELREHHSALIKQMLEFFGGQDYALSNIIANTFHYGSRHPEDKLSIALNICRLDFKLVPEALASPEARIYLLILALAAGDATILTTRGPKVQYGEQLAKTSWLHWPNETSWSTRHPFPLPEGIISLSADHVVLDLLYIPHEHFISPSENSRDRAQKFLNSALVRSIRIAYNLHSQDEEYSEEPGTPETLACALDCGMHWMAGAWHRIQDEVSAEVDQSFATVELLQANVLEALFGPYTPDSSSPPSAEQDLRATYRMILCILLFGRYWEFGTRVLLGPDGQMAISDLHCEAASFRVPIPSEHKLYSASDYSLHDRNKTFLAVPRVLANEKFGMSDRLWLVQSVILPGGRGGGGDEEVCWRVTEKVCLLGCGTIEPRPGYVYLKKRMKVVG